MFIFVVHGKKWGYLGDRENIPNISYGCISTHSINWDRFMMYSDDPKLRQNLQRSAGKLTKFMSLELEVSYYRNETKVTRTVKYNLRKKTMISDL